MPPDQQLHQPRLAEVVAGVLRDRIVSGQLRDGDTLPRQEDLLQEFRVSKPSLREALRILEAEGLISVRRGKHGGSVVHAPQVNNAAYMIALVLRSKNVSMHDVGEALRHMEPLCAGFCALREDRETEVLPALREIQRKTEEAIDDGIAFTRLAREFHEELVQRCGNQTMILLVGALERMWSGHEQAWAERATASGGFPERERRMQGLRAHERILELISEGDFRALTDVALRHLEAGQRYALAEGEDDSIVLDRLALFE